MTINKRRPELFALSDRNTQQRFRALWRRPEDKASLSQRKVLRGCEGGGEGWDGRCQVTQSCSGQLSLVFEPQEIYTNTHYSSDKKTCVCWPGNIQASPVLRRPAIQAPAGHMEDIKPTRVNCITDRRTGWWTAQAATPTYHGELGCRQGEGGCRGGQGAEGVEVMWADESERKGGFSSFEERTKGDCAKRCNCFNLLEISCWTCF